MATGWRGQYSRYQGFFMNIVKAYNEKAGLRAFLEIILSLATTTIFILFALRPTATTIIGLTNEIREKKSTVAKMDDKIRSLTLARNVYNQNINRLPDLDIAVNTVPRPDTLVKQIEGLAAKNSVEVASASIGEVILIGADPSKMTVSEFRPLPGEPYGMGFIANIKGSYASLVSFIKDLENLRIISRVDKLTISTQVTDTGGVTLSVAIAGRTPYIGK